MNRIVCLFLLLGISLVGCTQIEPKTINTQNEFDAWSSKPLYQKYGQVSAVKVVYDVSDSTLHFIPPNGFQYHYEYCQDRLGYNYPLAVFNKENYSGDDERRFLLGNINYYKAQNKFALELGPSDRMNPKQLQLLFEEVKKEVFFGDQMALMLNTVHVQSLEESLNGISFLRPSEIYQGQRYQPISKQKGKGRVLVIHDWEKQQAEIRPTDIVLLKEIPATFPLVSGVIVTEFQTPLSHVSILGQNRKIPICAYTDLFAKEDLLALNGKTVEFTVTQDTFRLVPKDIDLSKLWRRKRLVKLKYDVSVDSLIPIKYIKERHRHIVGNKAANFGLLNEYAQSLDFKTPESAFAIPFAFYDCHVKSSGSLKLIEDLLDKDNFARDKREIEAKLKTIRATIKAHEIDDKLLREVQEMIIRLGDYRRMRFRSSTNAEDREGFSGAGLYTSKTGEIGNPKKTIEKAIKKVWASLWSYGAFMEREAFNIDHSTIAMGILVHRSFPDEEVNGVAITKNLYRKDYLGFVINAQLGDVSVVEPDPGILCDQFICYPDETVTAFGKKEGGIDIINYSSLNNGELVMTKAEIQHLANVLEQIKKKYLRKHYTHKNYFDFGLDLEFKLDRDTRQLYIKQVRIFND